MKCNYREVSLKTLCYKTHLLWSNLLTDIKFATSLSDFKSKIKSFKYNSCTWRLYQTC